MEWASLVLGFVAKVAWPCVVLFGLVYFGKPIARRLDAVRKAQLPGGVELDFDAAEEAVEHLLEEAPSQKLLPAAEEPDEPSKSEFEEAQELLIEPLLAYAPTGAVVAIWTTMEAALSSALHRTGLPTGRHPASARRASNQLSELGVLSRQTVATIDRLARIRNGAAHGEDVMPGQAHDFMTMVNATADAVELQVQAYLAGKSATEKG